MNITFKANGRAGIYDVVIDGQQVATVWESPFKRGEWKWRHWPFDDQPFAGPFTSGDEAKADAEKFFRARGEK